MLVRGRDDLKRARILAAVADLSLGCGVLNDTVRNDANAK